ncbi:MULTISPECIES: tetratricopeptide repeat protein [Streptomyces]|uniref:tetratricopeptide repeat protein n=1 Tax=Streptomyces TaxID=1883 RepID=UPI0013025FCE|nr:MULTISPECIES: tetratricopeptide repeat protein [Streptomyces]
MPSGPESLKGVVEAAVNLNQTVIWLDEVQNFIGPGKVESETIRQLLFNSSQPAIIIGTIWPDNYSRLRSRLTSEDDEDPNRDAREILNLATRFDIAGFSAAERERAERIAQIDPRIREAMSNESEASLTEILAATPELVHRWQYGESDLGRLVITAAIMARVCGCGEPIPAQPLQDVTQLLMSGSQRARAPEGWFEEATGWACEPTRGSVSALAPYAKTVGSFDGYTVSDVLVQNAIESSEVKEKIPDNIWDILISSTPPASCLSILIEAIKIGNMNAAEKAVERCAASISFTPAIWVWAVTLERAGQEEKALEWWMRAAQDDGVIQGSALLSATSAGLLLFKMGRFEEGDVWLLDAARRGHSSAMGAYGLSLIRQGKTEEGIHWSRLGAEAGNAISAAILGRTLASQGRTEEAEHWLRKAAEDGSLDSQAQLGFLLARNPGKRAEALNWLSRGADSGNPMAMVALGLLLGKADAEEGRIWLQRAADQGEVAGMAGLGVMAAEVGDLHSAEIWYRRAAGKGNPVAIAELAKILRSSGRAEEAERWEQQVTDSDRPDTIQPEIQNRAVGELPPPTRGEE